MLVQQALYGWSHCPSSHFTYLRMSPVILLYCSMPTFDICFPKFQGTRWEIWREWQPGRNSAGSPVALHSEAEDHILSVLPPCPPFSWALDPELRWYKILQLLCHWQAKKACFQASRNVISVECKLELLALHSKTLHTAALTKVWKMSPVYLGDVWRFLAGWLALPSLF